MDAVPRQMRLNAFLQHNGHHDASWRVAGAVPDASTSLDHFAELARIAERGKMDAVFFADVPALTADPARRPPEFLDPTLLLAAMGAVTERVGLIASASTSYEDPFNLARRVATLDHLSHGRAGWNAVTTANPDAARNFGLDVQPEHDRRYERADEFLQVVLQLWDSWDDDAIVRDTARGVYADPAKIHAINHRGEFFPSVRGPLNVPRSPQGRPVLVQAGASPVGRAFAARYAEIAFCAFQVLEEGQEYYADIKQRAANAGRDPAHVLVLPGVVPVVGSTEAEAKQRLAELEEQLVTEYGHRTLANSVGIPVDELDLDAPLPDNIREPDTQQGHQARYELIVNLARRENLTVRELLRRTAGGKGHRMVVGDPEQIVDVLVESFANGAADGFNIMPTTFPDGLERFVDHVVPLLQARGYFRTDYAGTTLRDHLGLPRPAVRGAEAWEPVGDVTSGNPGL